MRVLLLMDSLGNGGAERQMALLATHLPPDWHARVCALGGGEFEAQLRASDVPVQVYERRLSFDPVPAAALWRSIIAWHPDVVHSWSWMSSLIAGPLCRLLGTPLIDGTIRTGALQPDHLWLKRIGMGCAKTIVANTRAGVQAWGVRPAKSHVVYNGFDWSRLEAASLAASCESGPARDSESPFTVVMTGGMKPARDYNVVIAAARLLQREQRPCRFLLVGHGPQKDELIEEAASLIADGTVSFAMPSAEVLDCVRRAQVGVLMANPEWGREGCSNAIMEYMACGLPVVCGEGGGNREVVEDGTTGFVIPPADAQALAERISYLRDHEAERRAMGEAGRKRILEAFSLERMVGSYLRIYREALAR